METQWTTWHSQDTAYCRRETKSRSYRDLVLSYFCERQLASLSENSQPVRPHLQINKRKERFLVWAIDQKAMKATGSSSLHKRICQIWKNWKLLNCFKERFKQSSPTTIDKESSFNLRWMQNRSAWSKRKKMPARQTLTKTTTNFKTLLHGSKETNERKLEKPNQTILDLMWNVRN